MTHLRLAIAAAVVALAVAVAPALAATPKLVGTDGPGFTITLKKAGKKVTKIKRGKYAIVVSDKSDIHNFRLKGPGLNKMITSVGFVGTKTVTVMLKPGKYTYVCDPHATIMKGSFIVTA
jgi:plastocyanin